MQCEVGSVLSAYGVDAESYVLLGELIVAALAEQVGNATTLLIQYVDVQGHAIIEQGLLSVDFA